MSNDKPVAASCSDDHNMSPQPTKCKDTPPGSARNSSRPKKSRLQSDEKGAADSIEEGHKDSLTGSKEKEATKAPNTSKITLKKLKPISAEASDDTKNEPSKEGPRPSKLKLRKVRAPSAETSEDTKDRTGTGKESRLSKLTLRKLRSTEMSEETKDRTGQSKETRLSKLIFRKFRPASADKASSEKEDQNKNDRTGPKGSKESSKITPRKQRPASAEKNPAGSAEEMNKIAGNKEQQNSPKQLPGGLVAVKDKKPKKSSKREARKNKKMVRMKLSDFDVVKSAKFSWKVMELLGSGGFGDVYKVVKCSGESDKKEYAMKTEMVEGDKRLLRLKIEVTVLKKCSEQDAENRKHFVEFVDRGITDKFKFVVMGLVGPSLEDIRRKYLGKNLSKPSALYASINTLKALEDLHALGWIHRDIKPQNYAVGLGDKEDLIYLLDFGIAKCICKPGSKEMKIPRSRVKFLGTLRFCSRACHHCVEQGFKDDVETWLYMTFDLFDTDALPWKRACDRQEVTKMKQRFFRHEYTKPYKIVPKDIKKLLDYVDKLGYNDTLDYKMMLSTLTDMGKQHTIKWEKKPEWVGKLKEKRAAPTTEGDDSSDVSSDNRQSGSTDGEEESDKKKPKNNKKKTKKQSQIKKRAT